MLTFRQDNNITEPMHVLQGFEIKDLKLSNDQRYLEQKPTLNGKGKIGYLVLLKFIRSAGLYMRKAAVALQ